MRWFNFKLLLYFFSEIRHRLDAVEEIAFARSKALGEYISLIGKLPDLVRSSLSFEFMHFLTSIRSKSCIV